MEGDRLLVSGAESAQPCLGRALGKALLGPQRPPWVRIKGTPSNGFGPLAGGLHPPQALTAQF